MKIHINVEECKRDSPQFRWEETKIMKLKYMYLELKLLCYPSFKHPWWSCDTQNKWWFFCYYYQEHDGLLLSRHTGNSQLSTGRLPDFFGVSWFWFSIFYPWISSLCCKWIFQSQHFFCWSSLHWRIKPVQTNHIWSFLFWGNSYFSIFGTQGYLLIFNSNKLSCSLFLQETGV